MESMEIKDDRFENNNIVIRSSDFKFNVVALALGSYFICELYTQNKSSIIKL